MNPKTTLVLAMVLVVVVAVFWLAGGDEPADQTPPKGPTSLLEDVPLIDDDSLGEVTRIVCQRPDQPEWTFERAAGEGEAAQPEWKMTSPFEAQATPWQVNGIVRRIKQLKYKLRFVADAPGAVTAAQAGLESPSSTVTLEDEDGKSVTVEVGRKFADNQTYVRLSGQGDVYAVSGSLDNLLKKKAVEYRDPQVFKFDQQHAERLEITDRPEDGEPVTYVLARSEAGWTFEAPVKAATVADKIRSAVGALANLRVTGWVEAETDSLGMYGLDQSGLTVRATIEEPPEPADEEPEEAEAEDQEPAEPDEGEPEPEPEPPQAPPEPVVRELVIHVSQRSPIGEATKVYVRKEGEQAVGTISKTVADRLRPNLAEWRDMRLTRVEVTEADRIDLTTPQGEGSFIKEQGKWVDEPTGAGVDAAAVTELLNQIAGLKASNFVEIGEQGQEAFGLDAPQATIRLNVPGEPEAQRFVVAGYTDPQRRRMVYVRHNEGEQVAKVRVAEVNRMIRDPAEYRDRTVFDLKPDQFQRLVITRQDELTGAPFTFALAKVDDRLQITEPVPVRTSDEQVTKLTTALAALKATKVMPEASRSEFGLDAPIVTCEITHQPPEMTRYVEVEEPAEEASAHQPEVQPPAEDSPGDAPEGEQPAEEASADVPERAQPATTPKLEAETYQPPAETYTLLVASHQGTVYAVREDRDIVYQVAQRILNLLQAEYHDPAIFDFEESQVVGVAVTNSDGTIHEFAKVDGQWRYSPEPDLPIDPKRVQDLLLRLKDLETERFISYSVTDPGDYGLDQPRASATVETDAGEHCLAVSEEICEADPGKRRYATLAGTGEVFLVSQDTIERFEVDLEEFEAP